MLLGKSDLWSRRMSNNWLNSTNAYSAPQSTTYSSKNYKTKIFVTSEQLKKYDMCTMFTYVSSFSLKILEE